MSHFIMDQKMNEASSDSMLSFVANTLCCELREKFTFTMPRVVPDQRTTFENDELFRKLARESEVRYTGFRDRPLDERQLRFQDECREGHADLAFVCTGTNLMLTFATNSWSDRPEERVPTREFVNFDREPGKVHLKSQFILNGVCVVWRGWVDLMRLDGVGCLEFDEERAQAEDAALRDQIDQNNRRVQEFEERLRAHQQEQQRQAASEAEAAARRKNRHRHHQRGNDVIADVIHQSKHRHNSSNNCSDMSHLLHLHRHHPRHLLHHHLHHHHHHLLKKTDMRRPILIRSPSLPPSPPLWPSQLHHRQRLKDPPSPYIDVEMRDEDEKKEGDDDERREVRTKKEKMKEKNEDDQIMIQDNKKAEEKERKERKNVVGVKEELEEQKRRKEEEEREKEMDTKEDVEVKREEVVVEEEEEEEIEVGVEVEVEVPARDKIRKSDSIWSPWK